MKLLDTRSEKLRVTGVDVSLCGVAVDEPAAELAHHLRTQPVGSHARSLQSDRVLLWEELI